MIMKNEELNQRHEVKVRRVQSKALATAERAPGPGCVMPVLRLNLTEESPLSVRPAGELRRASRDETTTIPHIKICLYDGTVKVNGRPINIPTGLSRSMMTGEEFKRFAGIYPGHALYVHRAGGLQRVRDAQKVEILSGAKFTHRDETPQIRTMPRYTRD